jgi:serine/threonine protein kinase
MEGGTVFSEGGQACIFYPSFSSGNLNKEKYVSKVIRSDLALKEYTIGRYLYSLDKQERFGLYVHAPIVYNVSLKALQLEGLYKSSRCLKFRKELERNVSFSALTYKLYQYDLSVNQLPNISKRNFVAELYNLWRSLAFIHANDVVHCDIKSNNIAFQKRNNKFYFRLTDWGWSALLKDQHARLQLQIMRQFPDHVPSQFGGNGIWCPLLYSLETFLGTQSLTTAQCKQILMFNDVFCLANFTLEYMTYLVKLKIFTSKEVEQLRKLCGALVTNFDLFWDIPTSHFVRVMQKVFRPLI